jgi:spore cortex biosynthesis protein YabQ
MITNQAYLFLIFVINGLLIGLLFDFFRILRLSFKTRDFVTYIEDIIFWIITGIIVLYSIFIFNNGEIRFFMFLGIALGAFLYMTLFSGYIISVSVHIIKFFKKIFGFILKLFSFVFKILKKIFIRPISFVTINIRKISTNLFKKIKINKPLRQKNAKIVK